MQQGVVVFAGESSDALARSICRDLKKVRINDHSIPVQFLECQKRGWFNDRAPETQLRHLRNAAYVVIVQSLIPVDSALTQLLSMCDAAVRASAQKISVVCPYFPGRQDKKKHPQVDITAAWIPGVIENVCKGRLDRFVSVDLHSAQIQGYANCPFDHLYALPVLLTEVGRRINVPLSDFTYVSPDSGGVDRVRTLTAGVRRTKLVIIDKERLAPGVTAVSEVIGDPGDQCIIVDDIGDSLGTLVEAARALKKKHQNARVYGMLTHAVFGGSLNRTRAIANINDDAVDHLFTTDTIPAAPEVLATGKVTVVSVAPLLARALERIFGGGSLNELFDQLKKPLRRAPRPMKCLI